MAPLRCTGIKQVVLADDGTAVLFELAMANGRIFPLELDAGGIDLLTRALLVSAQALDAKQQPQRKPLENLPESELVQLAVQALQVRPQADGGAALVLRAGSLDLNLRLPDGAAVAQTVEALRRPEG